MYLNKCRLIIEKTVFQVKEKDLDLLHTTRIEPCSTLFVYRRLIFNKNGILKILQSPQKNLR